MGGEALIAECVCCVCVCVHVWLWRCLCECGTWFRLQIVLPVSEVKSVVFNCAR